MSDLDNRAIPVVKNKLGTQQVPIGGAQSLFDDQVSNLSGATAATDLAASLERSLAGATSKKMTTTSISSSNLQQKTKDYLEENPYAVRLKSLLNNHVAAFKSAPDIIESRRANYKSVDPVHMPGAIQVYSNSSPRTWNVSALKLFSRNGAEAEHNLALVNLLRSWMMPFFGQSNTRGRDGYEDDLLGAPPEVLSFSAYSSNQSDGQITNIRNVPVVITNLSIPYSTDVDYIQTELTNQPFPTVMSIDMELIEAHSPLELEKFDIIDFRNGRLDRF